MKSQSFGNFQVGMVDNPSAETEGGFEFASGMDIFSEPGVMKACNALEEVSYGTGAAPTDYPLALVTTETASAPKGYIIAGTKVLESATNDAASWNLFLTNGNGNNLGLEVFNDYVWYAAASQLGRAPVGNAASKDDSFNAIPTDTAYHPMKQQAGTLKIGAGRYVSSVDETSAVIQEALKLPVGYRIRSIEEHFTRLFMGTEFGGTGIDFTHDAQVFDWNGIPLASGSALPGTPYTLKMRGMKALLSDGQFLYAFPDVITNIHRFDGGSFSEYRKIYFSSLTTGTVRSNSVCKHVDGSLLFGGSNFAVPGVFQMRNGAICQAFVPSVATPGQSRNVDISLVASSFNGRVYVGFQDLTDSSYHVQMVSTNRQNNAVVRTLWHRAKTDKNKRWGGVQLNLKPLGSCSVDVKYRTERNASFSASQGTITSSNQHHPLLFQVHPRSREIQFQFTYTTSGSTTPELLGYEPLFEVLSTSR